MQIFKYLFWFKKDKTKIIDYSKLSYLERWNLTSNAYKQEGIRKERQRINNKPYISNET